MASLTMSSAVAASGSTAAVALTLGGSAGPASLQWTLAYDPSAIGNFSVDPGPALAAAGKELTCAAAAGVYQCLAAGLNTTAIADGVVAMVTVTPLISSGTIAVGVTRPAAATASAGALPIGGVAGAITVFPLPSVSSLACSPSTVTSPGNATCTATLSGAAPPNGLALALGSSSASVSLPPLLLVPAGSAAVNFTASVSGVAANETATLTAAFNGSSVSAALSLIPPPPPVVPTSLACTPSSLSPGGSTTCTLILSYLAPSAGAAVMLASDNPALAAPGSVVVAAGAASTTFTATAAQVSVAQRAALTASLGGSSVAVSLTLNPPSGPVTLSVGPGQMYGLPCQALTAAADGATVQIDAAGTYSGDVCTIAANNLTVKGINGRPLIDAAGLNSGGKAAWLFQGDNITLDTVELTGAANALNNGAGVFMTGNHLTVLNSYIHDNQAGIVTAASPGSQVLIQATELNHNGFGDGQSHNADIGAAARFIMQYSYSHNANAGDLVRSQASENYIFYNRLTSEQGTTATEIELPAGGRSFLIGNLMEKGPGDLGASIVTYLPASAPGPGVSSELYLVNNTLVSDKNASATFLNIGTADPTPAVVTNNIFYGAGVVSTQSNSVLTANLTANPAFVNQAGFDYHLITGSPAIDAGINPGTADGVSLLPAYEYADPVCGESRNMIGTIDIGAYEFGGAGAPIYCAPAVSGITLNPSTVTGGAVTSGNTVNVSVPAFSAGITVSLTSSNPAVAAVPASMTVPSGAAAAAFSITTAPVPALTTVTISASYAGGRQSAALTVLPPPALSALQCAPASLVSSGVASCTVTLVAAAPSGGVAVNVTTGNPALTVSTPVLIPSGSNSAAFPLSAGSIASNQSANLTATLNGSTQSIALSLLAPPAAPANVAPAPAATAVSTNPVLSWTASANASSYDVYFGGSASLALITSTSATSYQAAGLASSTTYYWKVVANGPGGSAASPVWSFTTAAPAPIEGVPSSISVAPATGAGLSQTFTFTYADTAGYQSLKGVHVLISTSPNANNNACWLYYDVAAKLLWLSSDDTSTWSNLAPASGATLQNSQCQIAGSSVGVTGSGTSLTLTVLVTFSASFVGAKNIYLNAVDAGGGATPYAALGAWTVPSSVTLGAVSASPSSGGGSSQVFTLVYADPNGYSSIGGVHLMIGGTNGCWIFYDPASNLLWLAGDDPSTWSSAALGTAALLQNSRCSVDASGASAQGAGTNLTLQAPLTFTSAFSGSQTLWLNVMDRNGVWSPYIVGGTWIVP